MRYICEHTVLRRFLIALFALAGIILVVSGWLRTGELEGLLQMAIGVGSLLIALGIFNFPYQCKK